MPEGIEGTTRDEIARIIISDPRKGCPGVGSLTWQDRTSSLMCKLADSYQDLGNGVPRLRTGAIACPLATSHLTLMARSYTDRCLRIDVAGWCQSRPTLWLCAT